MTTEFILDKAGFPMIWVSSINAYMHWIPVTKVQFEYFICDESQVRFDEQWYETIRNHNPRITPLHITHDNYWQAFVTAITSSEAQQYANWCGRGYSLPTVKQWFEAYSELKEQAPISLEDEPISSLPLRERAETILHRLDTEMKILASRSATRQKADQMLMRGGIFEWVQNPYTHSTAMWVGMGKPHSSFVPGFFNLDSGVPTFQPRNPTGDRLFQIGFRLLYERGRGQSSTTWVPR